MYNLLNFTVGVTEREVVGRMLRFYCPKIPMKKKSGSMEGMVMCNV